MSAISPQQHAVLHNPPAVRLGGMSLLERQLFSLSRAGMRSVRLPGPRPDAPLRLPEGLELLWGEVPAGNPAPALWVSGEHLLRVETLRRIARNARGETAEYIDGDGNAAVRVGEAPLTGGSRPLAAGSWVRVRTAAEALAALPWLLDGARKGGDGFMARHFDRAVSLGITRRLLDTRLTPNHMTLSSTLVGLSGALLFLLPDYAAHAAGALLVWLHSVLDGCDGEIARIKFQESRRGRILDFWGDNMVHFALFTCMGIGLYPEERRSMALGALACCSALCSAWLSFRLHQQTAADAPATHSGLGSALQRVESLLAQRDFIYLLLAAALARRTLWFLWAAGIGSPLYLSVLLYLYLQAGGHGETTVLVEREGVTT